jgi:hypothetical protein
MEETDFAGIVKGGCHCVPRINIGLSNESCHVTFKNGILEVKQK